MNKLILLSLLLISACAPKPVIVATKRLTPAIEIESPKLLITTATPNKSINTTQLLTKALQDAKQRPTVQRLLNAITIYDFIPGSIYQIYTAPQKVTIISFETAEELVAPPQSGDTIRWQVNLITSGSDTVKQHLIIKPLRDNLTNNMIITTNKGRVYLLELISLKNSYMAEVYWNYGQNLTINATDNTLDTATKKLNFNYKIINKCGKPAWRPSKVFDDGEKTFIEFPATISQNELPALFIKTRETNNQLVNYRQHGNCFMVDKVINEAELRLGLSKPDIVIIKRGK